MLQGNFTNLKLWFLFFLLYFNFWFFFNYLFQNFWFFFYYIFWNFWFFFNYIFQNFLFIILDNLFKQPIITLNSFNFNFFIFALLDYRFKLNWSTLLTNRSSSLFTFEKFQVVLWVSLFQVFKNIVNLSFYIYNFYLEFVVLDSVEILLYVVLLLLQRRYVLLHVSDKPIIFKLHFFNAFIKFKQFFLDYS